MEQEAASLLQPINTKSSKRMYIVTGLVISIVVVLTIAVVFVILKDDNNNGNSNSNSNGNSNLASGDDGTSSWQKGCTSDDKVMMNNLPMNIDEVTDIKPLGLVVGGHVTPIDHLYFSPVGTQRDANAVYAMADGFIVDISARRQVVGTGEERPAEYRIIMQHSCQTISYFDLVTSLDQEILDQIPQLKTKDYVGGINVPIKANQEIGRIGGQTLDTAIYNLDLELPGFISPELYKAESWKLHTDNFYDYFSDELVAQMNTLNLRTEEPRAGKIDWDIPGKLVGNWFEEGTNGYEGIRDEKGAYWSGHLHFGYDAILPSNIWISIGDFDGEAKHFYIKGNTPDPSAVSVDTGIVKYELVNPANFFRKADVDNYQRNEGRVLGVILVQVMAGEKLKVEVFPNKTAADVTAFTSNAVMYER